MAAFMKMREEIKEKLGTDFAMWINLARISILVWHGHSIHYTLALPRMPTPIHAPMPFQ